MERRALVGVIAVLLAIGLAFGVGVVAIGAFSEPVAADCCGGGPGQYTCGNNICEYELGENAQNCWQDCII